MDTVTRAIEAVLAGDGAWSERAGSIDSEARHR
jgi:hypothetical protein